jgi:BASS family bile acid:Na+ symporter
MTIDRLTNILVTLLLVEMMVAVGLGVTLRELTASVRDWRAMLLAGLANYICFPAVTIGLLHLFQPEDALVVVGFLILAVCPGAPFGPACTQIAGGNVPAAVGMMVVLAGSSALIAPLLLAVLLPHVAGSQTLQIDAAGIVGALLATQLLPLCAGIGLRHWQPAWAQTLLKPANVTSLVLSVATFALILSTQFHLLARIQLRGFLGMLLLLAASLAIGWLFSVRGIDNRKALALTTALRNVGVGLVIATGSFANTAAQTAVVAYGLIEIIGALLVARVSRTLIR